MDSHKSFDSIDDKLSTLTAEQVMDKNIVSVTPTSTIKNTIEILTIKKISAICVVNNQYTVLGIVSEHDLLIQSASQDINDVIKYRETVTCVKTNTGIKDILLTMLQKKLKVMPVTNSKSQLVGYITRSHLLKILVTHS